MPSDERGVTDGPRTDGPRTDGPSVGHCAQGASIARFQDGGLAAFRAVVLADEALQDRLGAIDRPDAYLAEAMAVARLHGIVLDVEAIRTEIRPDPLGIGRWMPSPVTLDRWPSRGWSPARSVQTGGAPAFDWAWFGPGSPTAPFYEDTVRRFASRPFSQMFRTRTSLDVLVAGSGADPGLDGPAPSGFIHHMSRCGSTLVAQMLAADPRHVVLSEPEPLDAAIRWAVESGASIDRQIAAVRAVVAALSRDRGGEHATRRVFVKLDSWHTAALPLLRAAFPLTPWVFLYRNPVEILVSQLRQRGMHTVPGMMSPRILDIPGAETMAPERYTALVLAHFGRAVLEHWSVGGGLLVNYDALPGATMERIAPHFGLVASAAERAAMAAASRRDAKTPDKRFVPDTASKQEEATPPVQAIVYELLDGVYDTLEILRRNNKA